MADVDGGQVLAAVTDPLHQLLSLWSGELRVDEDGILLAADQHRGDRKSRRLAGIIDVQLQPWRGLTRAREAKQGDTGKQAS